MTCQHEDTYTERYLEYCADCGACLGTGDECDPDDAYDRDDPKHPGWLERHLEAADTRDKLPEK